MSPPKLHGGETEIQLHNSYSSDFGGEDISVLPVEEYIGVLENLYTSSTFTNARDYDIFPHSNTWANEIPPGVDPGPVGAIDSPPIPTHYMTIPFNTFADGTKAMISTPIGSTPWQYDVGSLVQTDLGMQWMCEPWPRPGSDDQSTMSARILENDNSIAHEHNPKSESVSEATTGESQPRQHINQTGSHYPSRPRKKKKSDHPRPCQEPSINSNASALTIDLTSSPDSATTPMPVPPDVSFDSADTDAQKIPGRSRSPRKSDSAGEKRRATQSPTPAPTISEQRARNRIAATKCRIKTKAAVAELEATEREESLKHEQLLRTARSLQADVFALKSEILLHGGCGDRLIQNYLNESARSLAAGSGGVAEYGMGQASPHSSSESTHLRH